MDVTCNPNQGLLNWKLFSETPGPVRIGRYISVRCEKRFGQKKKLTVREFLNKGAPN